MAKLMTTLIEKVEVTRVPGYTLTITEDEAKVLLAMTGCITGCSDSSPRKFTNAIYKVLSQASVDSEYEDMLHGTVHFNHFNKGNDNGK